MILKKEEINIKNQIKSNTINVDQKVKVNKNEEDLDQNLRGKYSKKKNKKSNKKNKKKKNRTKKQY